LSYLTAYTNGGQGGSTHKSSSEGGNKQNHLRGADSSGPGMLLYHAGFPRVCAAGTGHLLSDHWSIFEMC